MKPNGDASKILYDMAAQFTDPESLANLRRQDATLIADHIRAQPEPLRQKVFASHAELVSSTADKLFTLQTELEQAGTKTNGTLEFNVELAHTRFTTAMAKAGVGLDSLMEQTNSQLDKLASTKSASKNNFVNDLKEMSNTKKAMIGGAVALGAALAWNVFHAKHSEQSTDSPQR